MLFSVERQKFVNAVGILVIVQGLAWFSLSVAGIVVKKSPPTKLTEQTDPTTYSHYLSKLIYDEFMDHGNNRDTKVIRPQDFEAFLWIYAILSAIWVAASLDLHFALRLRKPRQSYITLVLGVAVLVTCVIDLVFFSLLARDFSTCPFKLNSLPATDNPSEPSSTVSSTTSEAATIPVISVDCKLASGIVMSLAARGYVLWLLNVVLGVCIISMGAKAVRTSPLLAYNNTLPRVQVPTSKKTPSINDDLAFFGDNDIYAPPVPPMSFNNRNRNNPVSLNNNNKNQMFY